MQEVPFAQFLILFFRFAHYFYFKFYYTKKKKILPKYLTKGIKTHSLLFRHTTRNFTHTLLVVCRRPGKQKIPIESFVPFIYLFFVIFCLVSNQNCVSNNKLLIHSMTLKFDI